jgi:excisionase family DNA binding protein
VASTLEHKGAERLIEALDCKRRQRRHAERAMQDVVGYISTEEAARRSGYHVNHIAVLAHSGRLLARRVGRRWLIDERALEAFVTNKRGRKRGRPRKV